jgi:hypothetical protein
LIYPYLGDALYAMMIFYLVATLFPRKAPLAWMFASIVICFSLELLQLYQAPWIIEFRSNKLVALVLGSGFLWSDLLAYLFGAWVAHGINSLIISKIKLKIEL